LSPRTGKSLKVSTGAADRETAAPGYFPGKESPTMTVIYQTYDDLKDQWQRVRLTLLIAVSLILTVLIAVLGISRAIHAPLSIFTRDPAALLNREFYYGVLNFLDIIGWSGALVVCGIGSLLAGGSPDYCAWQRFLRAACGLNLLILVNEVLLLHYQALPELLYTTEQVMVGTGIMLVTGHLLMFLSHIARQTDYLLLIGAGIGLGFGLMLEVILPATIVSILLVESLKHFGLLLWLMYFTRCVYQMVRSRYA
jgi:hypothetical protein